MTTTSLQSSSTLDDQQAALPNGQAVAAMVAAGIGSFVLGLMVILVEASPHHFKEWLNFYNPVGPLSGKTIIACAAYFISWIVLGRVFANKNVNLGKWLTVAFVLLIFGIATTFPPIYQIFTVKP